MVYALFKVKNALRSTKHYPGRLLLCRFFLIKVWDHDTIGSDDVMGVVVVPFESLLTNATPAGLLGGGANSVKAEAAAGSTNAQWHRIRPWDPLVWDDGLLTRAELRDVEDEEAEARAKRRAEGLPEFDPELDLGEVGISNAEVRFLQVSKAGAAAGAAAEAAEVFGLDEAGLPLEKERMRPAVARRLRLEVLGLEVHDVLGWVALRSRKFSSCALTQLISSTPILL